MNHRFVCFWCNRALSKKQRTRDHFVSQFIRKRLIDRLGLTKPQKNVTCCACRRCNMERGRISMGFQLVWRFMNNDWRGWTNGDKPSIKSYHKILRRLYREIELHRYAHMIKSKVWHAIRDWCLLEIDMVMNHDKYVYRIDQLVS